LPRTDRSAVDLLDDAVIQALGAAQVGRLVSNPLSRSEIGHSGDSEVADCLVGRQGLEPWTR
jgi:hypothetical protein